MKKETIEQFLDELRSLDVKLWSEGDGLRYKGPKNALTPNLLTQIKERKPEILTFLQQAQTNVKIALPPLLPRKQNDDIPLSFAQQRHWFLDQFESNNSAYNMSRAFHLKGELNLTVLEKSFQTIIQRHEVLRTIFPAVEGQPTQVILSDIPFQLSVTDGQHIPSDQKNDQIQQWLAHESQQTFNLSKGPLISVKLMCLAVEEHILLLTVHHIISDGWSMGIFMTELSALYLDLVKNISPSLPPLKIQYADFSLWQHQYLTQEVFPKQINYWLRQLADLPPILELPTDKPRPALQTFSGAHQSFTISQQLTKKIKVLCQQEGVTLFMTLLTAFGILLCRYSEQEDIPIGTPIGNRNRTEIETLIGCFVNTLVMRLNLEGNPTVSQLLKRVSKIAQNAYANQDLPFEKLVEQLQPERHLSHSPLFQVMFVFQNVPQPPLELAGLTFSPLEINKVATEFDLTLTINETEAGLEAKFEYNTDLFAEDTIKRMIGHFHCLLEGIVTNPDNKVAQLPLLTAAEKHQLLVEWNQTEVDYPKDKCIHQLFEAQVEKTPNAVAVVYEEQTLTYQQLNEKANQLAHYLQKLGVKPESLVGICVERSLEMIIGILAILKAGGAYIPFDPLSPKQRIIKQLKFADIRILLTQQKLGDKFNLEEILIISIDEKLKGMPQFNIGNLSCNLKSDQLAYVIFTSGSTGQSKGVTISHRSVINLLEALKQEIYKDKDNQLKRVSINGSFAFDTSVKQIIQLLHGRTLCIIPEIIRLKPEALLLYLEEHKIDVFDCTPSQLKLLLHEGVLDNPNAPECILVGGEAIEESLWISLSKAKYSQFYNVYGPTECTVDVTITVIDQTTVKPIIGRAIANSQAYILDQNLQPLPIGVAGELHIGGEGLARGYLNNPELTAKNFIPNPFGEGKLYKTGDLACYLPDGNIEYLGRIDHQVKIRGFRIELGEIETNLAQHPNIKDNVVIARENKQGDKYLTAYVVSNQGQQMEVSQLRKFLAEKLPEYMIPSAFVFLEIFPLTPNGKIDRQAFPEVDFEANREKEFIAPRNETEIKLAQIWQEVLGIEEVGINDDFFALGGHSLFATQVVSRIKNIFEVELPLRSLFEFPTIGELSENLINSYLTKPMITLSQKQDRETGEI